LKRIVCYCLLINGLMGVSGVRSQEPGMQKFRVAGVIGQSVPAGGFSDNFDGNVMIGVWLEYRVKRQVSLGLRGLYQLGFNSKGDPLLIPALLMQGTLDFTQVDMQVHPLELTGTYSIDARRTRLFAEISAGFYRRSLQIKARYEGLNPPDVNEVLNDTNFGIGIGGGLDIALEDPFGILLGASYHFVFHDEGGGSVDLDFPVDKVRLLRIYAGLYMSF